LFFLTVLTVHGLIAQPVARGLDPSRAITEYSHEFWQVREGLPQQTVQAIVQTLDGYLWVATQEGLVRFDGLKFTVFNRNNTPILRRNFVVSLFGGEDGSLWIGAPESGIIRLKDGKFEIIVRREMLVSTYMTSLYVDERGWVWIGSYGGLQVLSNGQLLRYTTNDGLLSNIVTAICGDRSGTVWVGTKHGLNRFRDGKISSYTIRDGLPENSVSALCRGEEGSLWIGTSHNVTRFHRNGFSTITSGDRIPGSQITTLLADERGTLWIGSAGGGLSRYSRGSFSHFTSRDGLSNDDVISLCEDREGNLWVGTQTGGLNRLSNGPFTTYQIGRGPRENVVWSVLQDRTGAVWLGTNGGVVRWKDGRMSRYLDGDMAKGAPIRGLSLCLDGSIVATTALGDVYGIRDGRSRLIASLHLPIMGMTSDRNGDCWIGSGYGLRRISGGKLVHTPFISVLHGKKIVAVSESREGGLWV
ncbi:MAG: hypothetical protein FJY85_15560, partial [Deltaproteobacteria bacterium]|nr:hypothetical protein [Deltaproteobacteria bacterium]